MSVSEVKIETKRRKCVRVCYHNPTTGRPSVRCFDDDPASHDKYVSLLCSLTEGDIDFKVEFTEGDGYSCCS